MFRFCAFLGSALLLCALVSAEQTGDKKAPPQPRLPSGWAKLKLSDEQKNKVYDIRGKYGAKVDALELQIEELKKAENLEMLKVLTEGQLEVLRKILAEKIGDVVPKKTDPDKDKKTDPDKKDKG